MFTFTARTLKSVLQGMLNEANDHIGELEAKIVRLEANAVAGEALKVIPKSEPTISTNGRFRVLTAKRVFVKAFNSRNDAQQFAKEFAIEHKTSPIVMG